MQRLEQQTSKSVEDEEMASAHRGAQDVSDSLDRAEVDRSSRLMVALGLSIPIIKVIERQWFAVDSKARTCDFRLSVCPWAGPCRPRFIDSENHRPAAGRQKCHCGQVERYKHQHRRKRSSRLSSHHFSPHGRTRMMQRKPRWQVEVSIGCAIRAAGL